MSACRRWSGRAVRRWRCWCRQAVGHPAGNSGLAISFCGKDEKPYWLDIEKLIRMKVKVVTDHQYTWRDEEINPDAKPDLRNKNKMNPNSNSRKSEASKKNKKRWY